MIQPLWRAVWRFPKKVKIELPYDPAIPLLGTYPKKMKTLIQKDTCTSMFIAALFTIAKIWKQTRCPSTETNGQRRTGTCTDGILAMEKHDTVLFAPP